METLLAAIVLMASVASAPEAPAKSEPLYLAVARRFVRFAGPAVKNAGPGRAVVTKTKGNTLTLKYPNGHEVSVEVEDASGVGPGDEVVVESGGLVLEKRRTRGLEKTPLTPSY